MNRVQGSRFEVQRDSRLDSRLRGKVSWAGTRGGRLLAVAMLGVWLCGLGAVAQVQQLQPIGQVGGSISRVAASDDYPFHAFIVQGVSLLIVSFLDPVNPVVVGKVFIDAGIHDIEVSGQYVYLGCGTHGVRVIDVSDITRPKEISSFTPPGGAQFIEVRGDLLYRTAGNGSANGVDPFSIIDVSDPTLPNVVHSQNFNDNPYDFAVDGSTAYFDVSTEYAILDLSGTPIQIGTFGPTGVIAARDGFVYVASSSTLTIYDAATPSSPVQIAQRSLPAQTTTIELSGHRAYVSTASGVVVFDVSDPSSPIELGTGNVSGGEGYMAVSEDLIFVSVNLNANTSLRVLDAAAPALIVEIGFYDTPFGDVSSVTLLGNFAYVTALQAGLKVLDVTQRYAPEVIGGIDTPDSAQSVTVSGANAFVADRFSGLRVYDISTPSTPAEIGVYNPTAPVHRSVVKGSYAYFIPGDHIDGVSGLFAVDVTNPSSPTLLDSLGTGGMTHDFAVNGQYAYLADTLGLKLVDITDPANLTLAASYPFPSEVSEVAISGNYAYIGLGPPNYGFRVLDITNPLSAIQTGAAVLDTLSRKSIALTNGLAFVSGTPGLSLFDVIDPSNPVEIARYSNQSIPVDNSFVDANGVAIAGAAYLGSFEMGLLIIPPRPPAPVLDLVPAFINADTVVISGTAVAGSFVTVGGGESPVFQQLAPGATTFSIVTSLRQTSVHTISVTTLNEFGLVSLPAIRTVVEGAAYPGVVTTVTALAVTPSPAGAVAINDTLAFGCVATFSNSATADVTQFVQWEDIANGEVITPGGLYLNNKTGTAQVRAFVAGVFSNVVSVTDAP